MSTTRWSLALIGLTFLIGIALLGLKSLELTSNSSQNLSTSLEAATEPIPEECFCFLEDFCILGNYCEYVHEVDFSMVIANDPSTGEYYMYFDQEDTNTYPTGILVYALTYEITPEKDFKLHTWDTTYDLKGPVYTVLSCDSSTLILRETDNPVPRIFKRLGHCISDDQTFGEKLFREFKDKLQPIYSPK